eukprot:757416-Hanusia_phi.AAC.1
MFLVRTFNLKTATLRGQSCAFSSALRAKFEFYEVQQSRQYNIAKIQQGYYTRDAEGQVPLENVLSQKFKAMDKEVEMSAEGKQIGLDDFVAIQSGFPKQKYLPSLAAEDPIIEAITTKCGARKVLSFQLLDQRWNGNYVLRYTTSDGDLFVKLNHREDKSVFVAEAVGLTSLLRSEAVRAPKPFHVGEISKGGEDRQGSFLITEFLQLSPFGSMTSTNQRILGEQVAKLHSSKLLEDVHKGRFGFMVNNFHSRTPLDNTWTSTWTDFFTRRLTSQLKMLQKEQDWRPFFNVKNQSFIDLFSRVIEQIPRDFGKLTITPSLLHGDLWIGNAGATVDGPVLFDPACFFGHSEFDLAIMKIFGGFSDEFFNAYHKVLPLEDGYEQRERYYMLYNYLNQLNLFGDENVLVKCISVMKEILQEQ